MKVFLEALKHLTKTRLFWPLAALGLLLLFNVIFTPGFLKIEMKDGHLYGRLIDILNRGGALVLIAIGMTLVIATKGIDISVGSICAISGAVTAFFIGGDIKGIPQNPLIIAIAVALFVSLLVGMWNGFLVSILKIQPVVATLIFIMAGRGIAMLITGGQIITVYYKPFSYIGGYIPGVIVPTSILMAGVVLIIAMLLVKKTSLGIFIQSSGINPIASRFAGINVKKIIFLVYAFSAVCAGAAGLILSSMIKAADSNNAGLFIEMDAILAVALGGNSLNGGKFSIMGSVIGAFTIQTLITTMYAIGVSSEVLPVVKAVVVIVICLIQSQGFQRVVSGLFNRNRRGLQHEHAQAKL